MSGFERLKKNPILYFSFIVCVLLSSLIFGQVFGYWLMGLFFLPHHQPWFALLIFAGGILADSPFLIRMIAERNFHIFLARLFVIYFVAMPLASLIFVAAFAAVPNDTDSFVLNICSFAGMGIFLAGALLYLFGHQTRFYQSLQKLYEYSTTTGILWK